MRYVSPALLLIAAAMLPATAVHATPITFAADLTGAAEIPPTGSPGTGHTTVVIDPALHTLHVDVTFSGLLGPTTASHIHCCVAAALPGNFIVATTTPTFPGFPLGVTSGTYDHTLDLTQATSYNPVFLADEGGDVAQAEAALEAAIEAGTAYLNIHTALPSGFPSGEIRGILVATPEPASLVLLGAALFGFGLTRRRYRSGQAAMSSQVL